MSNVHTLSDVRARENQQQQFVPSNQARSDQRMQSFNIERSQPPSSDPWQQAMNQCFPYFDIKSVTFAYVMVFLALYVGTEVVARTAMRGDQFLCVLYSFGGRFTYAIFFKYQFWRLITPMFLHLNFFHAFWNILGFFWIGFQVERQINSTKLYILLLVLGAVGGNLLSSYTDQYQLSVGASTSLFAVVGVFTTWFYFNFQNLGPQKYSQLMFLGFIVLMVVLGAFENKGRGVDNIGHIGALATGVFLAPWLIKGLPPNDQIKLNRLRIPFLLFLILSTAGLITLIYLHPLNCHIFGCDEFCS